MQRSALKLFVACLIIGAGMTLSVLTGDTRVSQAQEGTHVEIEIQDSTFKFHGGSLKPNRPTTLLLRNRDSQQHGFVSKLLEGLALRVETAGGTVLGKQIRGVQINPGAVIKFQFTPLVEGQFKFECDLHPGMKGELLILSIDAA